MKILLLASITLNLALAILIVDLGITTAHSSAGSELLHRRNMDLLKDLADVYLCKPLSSEGGALEKNTKWHDLSGVRLYISDGVVSGISLGGEPRPRLTCPEKVAGSGAAPPAPER